jgi:hypothetical protein
MGLQGMEQNESWSPTRRRKSTLKKSLIILDRSRAENLKTLVGPEQTAPEKNESDDKRSPYPVEEASKNFGRTDLPDLSPILTQRCRPITSQHEKAHLDKAVLFQRNEQPAEAFQGDTGHNFYGPCQQHIQYQ